MEAVGRSRPLDPWVQRLLDESPNAVLGLDSAGTVDYANPRAAELLARPRAALLGSPVRGLLPDWDGEASGADGETVTGLRGDGSATSLAVGVARFADAGGVDWRLITLRDESARVTAEADLTSAERGLAAMAALNEAVVRARDEQQLYDDVCRIAVEVGHYLAAWVGAIGPDGRVQALASAGELGTFIDSLGLRVELGASDRAGPTVEALLAGEAVFVDDYTNDPSTPHNRSRGIALGVRSVATLPLLCHGRVMAAVILYSPEPGVFNHARRTQLRALAYNVSVGLEGFAASRRLDEAMTMREQLHQRLVLAQEEERGRIAADVHDESIQTLAALDLRLGLLQRDLAGVAPELVETVDTVRELNRTVTAGLRSLLFDLEMPPPGTSLVDLVTEIAAHSFEGGEVDWCVEVAGDLGHLGLASEVHVQLVRILKEAFANVRRHAAARAVRVVLRSRDGGLEVTVTDDGRGLRPGAEVPRRGHRGLATMRDRAAVVGGWLRIEPATPGTTVRFWVPDGSPAADAPERLVPLH